MGIPQSSGFNLSNFTTEPKRGDKPLENPYDTLEDTAISPSFDDFDNDDFGFTSVSETPPLPEIVNETTVDITPPPVDHPATEVDNSQRKTRRSFVSPDGKTVEPLGGNRPVEPKKRKNKKVWATIIQGVVITSVLAGIGLAVYNIVQPPETLTEEDVVATVQNVTGHYSEFPRERAEGFAKDFIQVYLTNSTESNSDVLSFFYSGNFKTSNDSRSVSRGFVQEIVVGPTVYSTQVIDNRTASIVVGALVSNGSVNASGEKVESPKKWQYFNVNVYYDKDSDTVSIAPESPTLVPQSEVAPSSDVPRAIPLGDGRSDSKLAEEIKPVVHGFMNAFIEASPSNNKELQQYIIPDPPASLQTGLYGEYSFSGSVESAVDYEVFKDGDNLKALIKVRYDSKVEGVEDSRVTYPSTYVMTLQKDGSKWLVSRFQPYKYVVDESKL